MCTTATPSAPALAEAPLVVVSCFPFDDAEQTDALLEAVGSRPSLAIDPNPPVGMLHDREAFVRGFEKAAGRAQLVKVGEDDAQLPLRRAARGSREKLAGLGVEAVLATYGAGGAAVDATA